MHNQNPIQTKTLTNRDRMNFSNEQFNEMFQPTSFPKGKKIAFHGTELNRMSTITELRPDCTHYVLSTLFSDVYLTSHQLMITPKPTTVKEFDQVFFRRRQNQPILNDKTHIREKTTPTPKKTTQRDVTTSNPTYSVKRAIALLTKEGIMPKSSTIGPTSFDDTFPNTTLGHVKFIQGFPKIEKTLFNSLLISRLRALKSKLHLNPKSSLDKKVILHISRLIDHMIILKVENQRKKSDRTDKGKGANTKQPSTQQAETVPPKKGSQANPRLKIKNKQQRASFKLVSKPQPEVENLSLHERFQAPSSQSETSETSDTTVIPLTQIEKQEQKHREPQSYQHEDFSKLHRAQKLLEGKTISATFEPKTIEDNAVLDALVLLEPIIHELLLASNENKIVRSVRKGFRPCNQRNNIRQHYEYIFEEDEQANRSNFSKDFVITGLSTYRGEERTTNSRSSQISYHYGSLQFKPVVHLNTIPEFTRLMSERNFLTVTETRHDPN